MVNFKIWLENEESMPRYLYHVTPSCEAILKSGFIPASKLPHGSTVLGGGHPESVSFTYDLTWAKYYKSAFEEVRDMLNDSEYMYSDKMWSSLIRKFPMAPNGNYLIDLTKDMIKNKKDETEKRQLFFHMLTTIFEGHFPLMFGSGFSKRLSGDPDICILRADVKGLHLDFGSENKREKEIRVKNPEIITLDRISVV